MAERKKSGSSKPSIADRAGDVIREQMASMVEVAESSAADIERSAREQAEAQRREAHAQAGKIVNSVLVIEQNLAALLKDVSEDGDRLRAVVGRAKVRAAPRHKSLSAAPAPGIVPEIGVGSLEEFPVPATPDSDADTDADQGEAPVQKPDPTSDAESPPAREKSGSEPESEPGLADESMADAAAESETAGSDPEHPDVTGSVPAYEREPDVTEEPELPEDLFVQEDRASAEAEAAADEHVRAGEESPGSESDLLTQARDRVKDKSDIELAEMYKISVSKREGGEESKDWEAAAAAVAVVEEAIARDEFGVAFEPDPSLNRRDRRRQQRAIQQLQAAVASHLGFSSPEF